MFLSTCLLGGNVFDTPDMEKMIFSFAIKMNEIIGELVNEIVWEADCFSGGEDESGKHETVRNGSPLRFGLLKIHEHIQPVGGPAKIIEAKHAAGFFCPFKIGNRHFSVRFQSASPGIKKEKIGKLIARFIGLD